MYVCFATLDINIHSYYLRYLITTITIYYFSVTYFLKLVGKIFKRVHFNHFQFSSRYVISRECIEFL